MHLPPFHIEDFVPVISKHLDDITAEQRENIKQWDMDDAIMQTLERMLSDLEQVCISAIKGSQRTCEDEESSPLIPFDSEFPVSSQSSEGGGQGFSGVTCADVRASLGDTLHHCFGAALNLPQGWTPNSDHVTKVLAEAVAKALSGCGSEGAAVEDPPGVRAEDPLSVSSDPAFSLLHLGFILRRVMNQGPYFERPRSLQEKTDTLFSGRTGEADILEQQKVFVSLFIHKLVDHIASVTNTTVLDVNFGWLVEQLRERTVGQLGSYLPDHVGDLHVRIYKDLRWDFGGALNLYCAIFNYTEEFLDTVVSELKAELRRMSKKGQKKSEEKKSQKKSSSIKEFFCNLFRRGKATSPEEPETSDREPESEKRGKKRPVLNLVPVLKYLNRFF